MGLFILVKEKIKNNSSLFYGLMLSLILWICLWATYNTDVFRIFMPGFPHSFFDLIHGVRSIFPLIALVVALFILVKNGKFNRNLLKGPLGLLVIFSLVGIAATFLSKEPLKAFYWGMLYLSVLIILLTIMAGQKPLEKISFLIKINWFIAGVIAIGLLVFFLIQPGIVSSLTYNFLICAERPYEGLSYIGAATNTFDMVGTRPTGFGRYAGIAAIVSLVIFFYTKKGLKIVWFSVFFIFLLVLLFSKGKTEIIALILSVIFVIWLAKRISIFSVFGVCVVSFISFLIIFYSIPCINSSNFISSFIPATSSASNTASGNLVGEKPTNIPVIEPVRPVASNLTITKSIKDIITLSGRTSGVWTDAWYLFLSNPLVGYGFQADRFFLNGQHAHNSIIHALVQAGILGTIPFIFAFVLTFLFLLRLFKKPQIEEKQRNFLITISAVLVFFTVRSITESVAFFSADWLFVAPIIAYIQCLDSQMRKENENLKMDFYQNKIDLIKASDMIEKIKYWIKNESQKMHQVIVTGMHGVVEAEKHADFKYIINNADLFVPDGISLVWLARLQGFDIRKRISGTDVMQEFFKVAAKEGFSNYFYGDTDETLQALKQKLLEDFPNLKIAGTYSPPFRELTEKEDEEIIGKINQAKPDVLWVALGLPKQERWVFEHREKLKVPVAIGVGAAFKFLSGKVKRAPAWVGNIGFEWLWRLVFETKTVWRRVSIDLPFFIWLVLKSFFKINSKKQMIRPYRLLAGKVLLFIEKNILFPVGIFVGQKLLKQLTPYDAKGFEEKIRLGNLFDGGYVVPYKILPLVDVVYSYGIGNDISFEEDLVKHIDIRVRLYDHTVEKLPVENKNFSFKRQGIAERKYSNLNTFKNNLEENGDASKKILLKLDVEGAEWKVLDKIIDESSKNIVAIILEIHKLYRYEKIMRYIEVLKKINSKFTVAHLHGNNICGLINFGNKKIPDVLELTLINNNLISSKSIMTRSLPLEKDCPSEKGKEDIPLDFWKK